MSTLRTIHIGYGQTEVAGVSYATHDAFLDDIGVGLDGDISVATGNDEDWLLLLYGDNSTFYIETTGKHQLDTLTTSDGQTITYRPAIGHRWSDNITSSDAYTYHGPPKGVTVRINNFDYFTGVANSYAGNGLKVKVEAGFQFTFGTNGESVVACTNGSYVTLDGAIINQTTIARSGRVPVNVSVPIGHGYGGATNNLILMSRNAEAVSCKAALDEFTVQNNTIVYMDSTVSVDPAILSTNGGDNKKIYNNIVIGAPDVYDSNKLDDLKAFITDGTAANNADIDGTTNSVLSVDPIDVFELFNTLDSTTPADYNFRLKSGSPAIGVGQFITGQSTTDLYGEDRSVNGFDAGPIEYVSSGITLAGGIIVSSSTANSNITTSVSSSASMVAQEAGASGSSVITSLLNGSLASQDSSTIGTASLTIPIDGFGFASGSTASGLGVVAIEASGTPSADGSTGSGSGIVSIDAAGSSSSNSSSASGLSVVSIEANGSVQSSDVLGSGLVVVTGVITASGIANASQALLDGSMGISIDVSGLVQSGDPVSMGFVTITNSISGNPSIGDSSASGVMDTQSIVLGTVISSNSGVIAGTEVAIVTSGVVTSSFVGASGLLLVTVQNVVSPAERTLLLLKDVRVIELKCEDRGIDLLKENRIIH